MIALPRIVAWHQKARILNPTIEVRNDLEVFRGHFPGMPILAGVIQVAWVEQLARKAFALTAPVVGLEQLKFRALIKPGITLDLRIEYQPEHSRLIFEYRHGETPMASGRLKLQGHS